MERLTIEKSGEILIKYNDGEYRSPCFGCENINKCNPEKAACGFYKALEKLKEYENLEEQGKLLKLPCVVGDTVFVIRSSTTGHYEEECEEEYIFIPSGFEIYEEKFDYWMVPHIGKFIFITQQEAESALKEL